MTLRAPREMQTSNGTRPFEFCAVGSAPAVKSSTITSSSPAAAASCKGVWNWSDNCGRSLLAHADGNDFPTRFSIVCALQIITRVANEYACFTASNVGLGTANDKLETLSKGTYGCSRVP